MTGPCALVRLADRRGAWLTPAISVLVTLSMFGAIVAIRPAAFFFDDFQSQYLPAYVDVARALREGSFPLLSPYAWYGGALAGEYQYGVFSAFLLPLLGLTGSLRLSPEVFAGVIAAVHLAVLAAGCSVLMRSRGASVSLAVLVSTAIPFGGFFFCWGVANWFPMATSFAWVPWAAWAFFRALDAPLSTWRASLAALFVYLVLAGGWPFSGASLFIWIVFETVVACWSSRSMRPLVPLAVTSLIGLLLSAPSLLMLVEHTLAGNRLNLGGGAQRWAVPLDGLLGLFAPSLPVFWMGFAGGSNHPSSDLFLGVAIPAMIVAAVARGGVAAARRVLPEIALVLLFTSLSMSADFGPFRWPFRWLPFQTMALGLLLVRVETVVRADRSLGVLVAPLIAAVGGLCALPLVFITGGTSRDVGLAASLVVLSVAWAAFARGARAAVQGWIAVAASCGSLVLVHVTLPNPHDLPRWAATSAEETAALFQADRRYVSLHDAADAYAPVVPLDGLDRHLVHVGNQGMLEGTQWVNGYSALTPRGMRSWFEFGWSGFVEDGFYRRLPPFMAQGGLFDQLGISGVVVPNYLHDGGKIRPTSLARGPWHVARTTPRFLLIERSDAPPSVRSVSTVRAVADASAFSLPPPTARSEMPVLIDARSSLFSPSHTALDVSETPLEILEDNRLTVRVRLSGERVQASALVFSRPFFDGYRARFAGRELPVEAAYGVSPLVVVPPGGGGELRLFYRPTVLVAGALAAATGVLGALSTLFLRRRGRGASERVSVFGVPRAS